MNTANSYEDTVSQLAEQGDAVGRLAQNSGAFSAAFAAFESKNPNAFRWVLERQDLLLHCEEVCHWVRIKACVLRCFEVCGPSLEKEELPDFQKFVRAIVQLASNEKLLRRVVDAVSCGDADAYQAAIDELKLHKFCHLVCHYVCGIIYRRVCELVCTPQPPHLPDAVSEIRAAAKVMSSLIANAKALEAISKAAATLDCVTLRSSIEKAGLTHGCEIFCRTICTYRCVRVCRILCERPTPVLAGACAVEEAREFALAFRQLTGQPRALADLVDAVQNEDVKAYDLIIDRYGLGPYCFQICALVCTRLCWEFCICVCPPPALQPWFTTVGYFDIYSDIDAMSGKTNKGLAYSTLSYNGGPKFSFYGNLQLGGFCPINSPTSPGVAMKYRFLYDKGSGPVPITGSLVTPVVAGTRLVNWPQNVGGIAGAALVATFQTVTIAGAMAPDPTPPAPGAPWFGPSTHTITPDANGWVVVDPNAIGGGFQTLMGFDTYQVVPGGVPLPGVPAGTAVPSTAQRTGTDLSITFEATRVTTLPPGTTADYSNALSKIHINNWTEVNELNFIEFSTGCCTGIDATLSVQFTVDHEEMNAGGWSLAINSCSLSAPGNITPAASGPGVIVIPRGGSGTIVKNTSAWSPCSYTATLTTRPGLTTGLTDYLGTSNPLTFCICGH